MGSWVGRWARANTCNRESLEANPENVVSSTLSRVNLKPKVEEVPVKISIEQVPLKIHSKSGDSKDNIIDIPL